MYAGPLIVLMLVVLAAAGALGGADTRDGRDWAPPRREGDRGR